MTAHELKALLEEFYRDKLAIRNRHVAASRLIADYETNNTYQYILNRDDLQLTWLRDAIVELGREIGAAAQFAEIAEPEVRRQGKGAAAEHAVIVEDRDAAQRFVDGWRERVDRITHARHRGMLRVILGEALEQKRFFDLALAGRDDLLGRRMDGASTGDGVLPTRWVE